MKGSIISALAEAVAVRRCALFAGAGLTASSGGATWDELVSYLKEKYAYTSPLKDEFRIVGDMVRKYGGDLVYKTVQERLKAARILDPLMPLIAMPWFTVFTTNYDLALEKALLKNQSMSIRTIVTGTEFALTGLESELLCVKLMGSLDISYKQPGAMVLDPGDLAVAREQRARIFDILATHAANLSFLFVGYSFNDNLFFEMLEKLMKNIGIAPNTYYAVFKENPDAEKEYLLQQYGVRVIVDDLSGFIPELDQEVKLRNPRDFSLKRIPIGSNIIPVDVKTISGFLSMFSPVLFEHMEKRVEPYNFLKGDTSSFKPFELGWQFPRKEVEDVITAVRHSNLTDDSLPVIKIIGNPGTGRTFTMLAALYRLIKEHNAIAVQIPSYAICPEFEEVEEFIEVIQSSTKEASINMPEWLLFWADFSPDESVVTQFRKIAALVQFPVCLIYEDYPTAQVDIQPSGPVHVINVDKDLDEGEKKSLADYLLDITRRHRLPEINADETYQIINEEKRFLPIIYRVLDPARRSINQIVQDELSIIQDPVVRTCISLCALTSSMDVEMPIAVLKRALGRQSNKQISYAEIFDIMVKARAFLKESDTLQNTISILVYNTLIAQYIVKLLRRDEMDSKLMSIAEIVDIRSKVEADFVRNLLIDKGVNKKLHDFISYSEDALIHALVEIQNRQPARPILHHLARLYVAKNVMHEAIMPLLTEALAEPVELYALKERKENILTTLAKTKWEQHKQRLLDKDRLDPEIQEIFALLTEARKGTIPNIHPYDVHARILKDLWHKQHKQLRLANEAFEVIHEGLSTCRDEPVAKQRLEELEIEWLSEIDQNLAEATAEELLTKKDDGTGFYTLARIEYHKNSNREGAIRYLDKAMEAQEYPAGVVAFKIELLLYENDPDYKYLLELVEQLEYDSRFQDDWKSAYHKAVIYTINGRYEEATKFFKMSFRMAPSTLQRNVQIFWMEKEHRKVHTGKVGTILTEREGRIYSHGIAGYKDAIYFDPRRQKDKHALKTGLYVDFDLGFSPRGPIAFDVRPHYE